MESVSGFVSFFLLISEMAWSKPGAIKSWLCVYYKIPVEKLQHAGADLLVLDPDAYAAGDIARLKGNATVLAYLSIGEAESYRDYYSGLTKMGIVKEENPHWQGNFAVHYWHPQWRRILLKYARAILQKGFDGFFFDVVDAWEQFPEQDQELYRHLMEHTLIQLVDVVGKDRPPLFCMLQNSHELLANPEVRRRIGGINQEGLFASWASGEIPPEWQKEKIRHLTGVREQGLLVTLLEYTRHPARIKSIGKKATRLGFIPYFSVKELDRVFRPYRTPHP